MVHKVRVLLPCKSKFLKMHQARAHIIILNNIDVKTPRVIAYDMPAADSQQFLSFKFVSYGNVFGTYGTVCSLLHKICSEEACKIAFFFPHGIRPAAFLMPIGNKCCIVVLAKLALVRAPSRRDGWVKVL